MVAITGWNLTTSQKSKLRGLEQLEEHNLPPGPEAAAAGIRLNEVLNGGQVISNRRLIRGRRGGRLGAEVTTTVEQEDTITDELAVESEEDSPSADDMLMDRDPGK